MLEALLIVLLAAHLLCANVAAAGPLLAWRLEFISDEFAAAGRRAALILARYSLAALAAAALLGIVIALAQWDASFSATWLRMLAKKSFWGAAEIAFSAILLGWYLFAARGETNSKGRTLRAWLLFLAGTNLLYHFPLLFTIGSLLRHIPEPPAEWLDAKGLLTRTRFYAFMADPGVLARALHVAFASLAAAGVTLTVYASRCERTGFESPETAAVLTREGARWGLWASLMQIPIGVFVFLSLPGPWQQRALGGDLIALALFGLSMLVALSLLQDLGTLAYGERDRKIVVRTMILFAIIVTCMTGVLRRIQAPLTFQPANIAEERNTP